MMSKSCKPIFAVLLVVAMVLSLAACAGGTTPSAESSTPAATSSSAAVSSSQAAETSAAASEGIVPGSKFRYWVNYDIPIYVPYVDNRGSALFFQIYDNLLYKYHGDKNDIRPDIAESYTVSDDKLVWTFKIRKDAKFSSGNPVTAQAFVKTWDVAKKYQPRYFSVVKSYEAVNDYELKVTLNNPSPTFIYDLPSQPNTAPVDPATLDPNKPEDNAAAVGCGPYVVESYNAGKGFVLKANPNYTFLPEKMPSIETCELVIIPDENTALIALTNGELECMNTVNIEVYKTLKEKGWNVIEVEDRVNPYWFNAKTVPLFANYKVREALCHMVNWDDVSNMVYDGKFPASKSYSGIPGQDPGAVAYSDKYKYDPELGLKLLAEAGVKPEDVKFTILADPDFTNQEMNIVAQLNKLGLVNVKTQTLDGGACYGALKGGTYEMFPCHNGYGTESPLTPYTMGLPENGNQRCMWLDYMDKAKYAEAMKLYNAANSSSDWDTYVKNTEALVAFCQEECLAMGGIHNFRFYGVSKDFEGVYVAPITGYIDFCYLRVKK